MNRRRMLAEWVELWRRTDTVYVALLKRWKLSLTAFRVLELLRENPEGIEPARLAEGVGVQRQLVAIILRGFEAKKRILRRTRKDDRRRDLITLSASGKKFADEVCAAVEAADLRGLGAFSAKEQATLLEYSRRFYEALRGNGE